ncbi:MAG TPA: DUF4040 domain-containing protein [Acidimicrobiales bacterium]|nr:DUF4040 domain-containing protein [Acidimicrobiales bacterium]
MTPLLAVVFTLAGLGATAVVTTRQPSRQVVMLSIYGLVLAVLFFVVQQPDVALSQFTVGAVVLPIVVMLTLRKVSGNRPEDGGGP